MPLAFLRPSRLLSVSALLLLALVGGCGGADPVGPLGGAVVPERGFIPESEPRGVCGAACFSGVWLLVETDTILVLDTHADARLEKARFAAPPGTVSIAHDGARLLTLSPAGVDALDPASGAVLEHLSDMTGRHVAAVRGRPAVATGREVRFLDGEQWRTDLPIGEIFEFDGALAYNGSEEGFDPEYGTVLFWNLHRLVDGRDWSSPTGEVFRRVGLPSGGDGLLTIVDVSFGSRFDASTHPNEQYLWGTDYPLLSDHGITSAGAPIEKIPLEWHVLDVTAR